MLGVVGDLDIDAEIAVEPMHEGGDRPVALAHHGAVLAVDQQLSGDRRRAVVGADLVGQQLDPPGSEKVLLRESGPHVRRADLGAGVLGDGLNGPRELDLQPPGQVEAVLGLHDVGDPALAGLAVDPHHRFVRTAHVLGVDRQVRHAPLVVIGRQRLEALLDDVLMRARERGVDEVADVRMPRENRQPVAVLGHPPQRVDVADVELGVDALAEQVHGQVDDVAVAGALAVAEQGALHPVSAGHDAELGRRHRGAPIVVGVQRQHHRRAVGDVAVEPLDGVAVDVGRVHLDGGRQVQHDPVVGRRLDHLHHRRADVEAVVELGAGEALGRVLVADRRAGQPVLQLAAQLRRVDRDLGDARLVQPEHDSPLQH